MGAATAARPNLCKSRSRLMTSTPARTKPARTPATIAILATKDRAPAPHDWVKRLRRAGPSRHLAARRSGLQRCLHLPGPLVAPFRLLLEAPRDDRAQSRGPRVRQ